MKISNREKRDWSLLFVVVPIGIFLMMIAGRIAVRIVPIWSVNAGMQSSLDLNTTSKLHRDLIQPILPDILTPVSWFKTFLTPGANSNLNVVFPAFVVFDPSATPSPTTSPVASPTVTATPPPSPTIVVTPRATSTKKPPSDDPPPAKCTDVGANNNGGPLPCTYTPISSPLVGSLNATPPEYNNGTPNGSIGTIPDGMYIVLDLSLSPIIVNGPSDTNYDFVYYEEPNLSGILMDRVILSISKDNITYYVVFNWGDGIPDTNSNVGDVALSTGTEDDNQPIDQPDLGPYPTGELYGTAPLDTGILVDVDNAPSHPPPGSYPYLAIQAPAAPASTDNIGMDSVEVTEVPP